MQDDLFQSKIAGAGLDTSLFRTAVAALFAHALANYLPYPTRLLTPFFLDLFNTSHTPRKPTDR